MKTAFSDLPKQIVEVTPPNSTTSSFHTPERPFVQYLGDLRSHHIVYIHDFPDSDLSSSTNAHQLPPPTIVVHCNQRCHQLVIHNCVNIRVFVLDSAVVASRTISVSNSSKIKLFLEDVDIRRVESWNVFHSTFSVIGDDVLSEETAFIWNNGCSGNVVRICDLLSSDELQQQQQRARREAMHGGDDDQDVIPHKILREHIPTSTAHDLEARHMTVLKPITYPHTVSMSVLADQADDVPSYCQEARDIINFQNKHYIPDQIIAASVPPPTPSTFVGLMPPPLSFVHDPVIGVCEELLRNPPPETPEDVARAYDEERLEYRDPDDSVRAQASNTAAALRAAKYSVVFTGAGISTAASIPDFRGPKGLWTTRDKTGSTNGKGLDMPSAFPTYSHYALTHLAKMGLIKFVVSTNMDGLHCRSGLPRHMIEELHGSCYTEICKNCNMKHIRQHEVNPVAWGSHATGGKCRFCHAKLEDSIVNFAETYRDMTQPVIAGYHCRRADFALVLGTSMAVQPAVTFPLKVLDNANSSMCLVNMQHTPADKAANIRVYSEIDTFLQYVMEELGVHEEVLVSAKSVDALAEWAELDRVAEAQAAARQQ